MFQIHKKPQGDAAIKKSVQKILDHKKDIVTRLKHLRLVLVTEPPEIQSIFEQYYSYIYYVFYENFMLAEANVRQKGAHRAQREELDNMLQIFETILVRLPEMLHERWQYNSIEHIIKKLLHPGNSLKMRREGVRFFLLWFRALREHAREATVLLYSRLVPGFPSTPTNNELYADCTLESLLNPVPDVQLGMCPAEITCLVPPPAGEKVPPDLTKFFLDTMLEFMVAEARKLQWKDDTMDNLSFSFLWDMFKKYYLPHIFHDFHFDTSVYQPDLALPEPREPVNYVLNVTDKGTIDACIEVAAGCPMLPARVSTIKWIVTFTSNALRNEMKSKALRSDAHVDGLSKLMQKHMQQQRLIVASVIGLPDKDCLSDAVKLAPGGATSGTSTLNQEAETSHSNTSTLTEKAPSLSSLSSLDDKLRSSSAATEEEELVRNVLYSTRENVNIVHEVFRQALMLPLTEATTMRRVVKVYQEWIQEGVIPIFMEDADLNATGGRILNDNTLEDGMSDDDIPPTNNRSNGSKLTSTSIASLRNTSYMRGQLNPIVDQALSSYVRAGCQTTYQLFVTNSAHVFLVEPPTDAPKLVQAQVDVCKRVLNLYRHMVMHVTMDRTTWTQLLQVLLHITRIMLQDTDIPQSIRASTVAARLAGPVFQTLIVSWIKANLFVHVSRELWDELVDVLSSLMQWTDLIVEWAKNMDTMTRVLARHVYGLELSDLPLDRLTEQKQKKNRKIALRERLAGPNQASFSKGWSRESIPPSKSQSRIRSRSAIGSSSQIPEGRPDERRPLVNSGQVDGNRPTTPSLRINNRGRSVTVLGLEASPETEPSLLDNSVLGNLPEHTGHVALKRGMSDNSSLSVSPPIGGNMIDAFGGKAENLQRSSSTSDIASEMKEVTFPNISNNDQGETKRQRCNSGPGYRDGQGEETVHGLKIPKDEDDGITSLSSVEDTFNDMFDELIQQRLNSVNPKPQAWNKQPDVISVKSQDSGSIDPNWNPWGETEPQHRVSTGDETGSMAESTQDRLFADYDQKGRMEYADLRDDEANDWGTCLEDSHYGDVLQKEDHSSDLSHSTASSDNEYNFSSTTGTLTLSESCLARSNVDIPKSNTSETASCKLENFKLPVAVPPNELNLKRVYIPPQLVIHQPPSPLLLSRSYPLRSHSNPTTPSIISPMSKIEPLKRSRLPALRRTKSFLSYSSRNFPSLPRPKTLPSRTISSPSLVQVPAPITFPLTKLSSTGGVEEPINNSNDSFNCPIKLSRSMHCFPCLNVDGTLPSHLAEQHLTPSQDEAPVNERVSMLSKEQNTSSEAASPGLSSPPYQIYKSAARNRYDSTALLLPDSHMDSRGLENQESILEEEEGSDSPDADTMLEKSSDDILGLHCSTPQIAIIRHGPDGFSDIVSGDESGDDNALQSNRTGDSILAPSEDCSILAGGRRTGWYPDVAVALWRRLLGVLGDINAVEDPVIHQLIFTYLLKFWDVLFKMRENLGITTDNTSTPKPPELVPPLRIMAPWAFKAVMSLSDTHKGGRLHAYQLLCNTTLQNHDTRLEPDHLALFYMVLHEGLHSVDQDVVNEIVESSSPRIFSCDLPASTLLLLDFIYACHAVAASTDLSGPRVEAQTILGSILCFPNLYYDLPVLNPDSKLPQALNCNNIKEYVADALLTSAKKEPSAPARCVALSSLGVWLYEELTAPNEDEAVTPSYIPAEGMTFPDTNVSPVKGRHLARHGRVKEAINVLLVSLKFNNRNVASIACTQLHLITHCIPQLLEYMPEMPARIIELSINASSEEARCYDLAKAYEIKLFSCVQSRLCVMSLTASSLLQSSDAKSTENGRQLLVSLLLCICDWCMLIPLPTLVETTAPGSDKRLIRTVFKALQTGALGKPGHSAKHSYSLSDLASKDFDPYMPLDKVQEGSNLQASATANTAMPGRNKLTLPPMPSVTLGTDNVVSLTASTVLNHLTNHLGHFPLAKGPAVLNSLVTEGQDHGEMENTASADLSNELFNSPNVQFLIYNDTCLLSVVEIPAQNDVPGGGQTAGLSPAQTDVRIIVRDMSGKFCWDSSILYGTPDIQNQTKPVTYVPLSTLDKEISKIVSEHCQNYVSYVEEEMKRKRRVTQTPLPSHTEPLPQEQACDKLDQLLQYIGWSSPECQEAPGRPLNIPAAAPQALEESRLQGRVVEFISQQNKTQSVNCSATAHHTSCQSKAVQPVSNTITAQSPFHQSRLLISECGFLSRENRRRVSLLKKNERLLRELKNLDSRYCRETHKVAVLYIAPGQEDKLSVLSNTAGSEDFEQFVSGLGWEVDLKTHSGFRGKLNYDGSTGTTSPYYSTSTLEVVFHVSTRFPSTNVDSRNIKLKHLGNDEVHIVWSEHSRDYRRGIIPTEFGDVLIIIYPMKHMLYRIQIKKKEEVPYFGPLFDGAIVNARVLPVLVRETAINAGRAKRSQISLYQPFYEERTRYLRQIIEQFKDDTTFEDYAAHLFSPAHGRQLSPGGKGGVKRPAPKPSPPPVSETPPIQSGPPTPSGGKATSTASLQSSAVANGNNNNSSDAASHRYYDYSFKNNGSHEFEFPMELTGQCINEEKHHQEQHTHESYRSAHYISGTQVSNFKATPHHPLPPIPPPLVTKSSLTTTLIATPRPKPSHALSNSLSSLNFTHTPAQHTHSHSTPAPVPAKIHIPVSKIHASSYKSDHNISSTPSKRINMKTSSSNTGVILVPPPPGSRNISGHPASATIDIPFHPSSPTGKRTYAWTEMN